MSDHKDLGGKVLAKGASSMGNPADRTGGRKYGREWGTYQATGGYRPSSQPHNPTPADAAQNKRFERKVDDFGRHERNSAKIDVRKGEQRR